MPDAKDLIFGPLNEEQAAAVSTLQGPVLILAGAGSGKTRALTHRIANLIDNGVPPWQILSVTFTNKAATEMKERIASLLHITEGTNDPFDLNVKSAKLPIMGTFHSVCVRILRRDIEHLGRDRNFVIYDGDDQIQLMKRVLKECNIDEADLKPKAALSHISRMKAEGVSPKEAKNQASTDKLEHVLRAYDHYQMELRRANALDFDDLILETVRLFHECPDVLERYQETWKFLHIDEYQDTNHAQYMFITLLAQKYRNLCVIGDPDQSIYGFRGADIRNILEFEKEYKDAVRIKLEQNYRSTQQILDAADSVIAANPGRPEKHMWTDKKDGAMVTVHEVADEKKEADEALRLIEQALRDGTPLREQVIVYRTHAQSRLFEEACMRRGIPYRLLGGVKFYARREVKDVLAYLYTILNPYDTVSLLRIINTPSRKIGNTTLEKVQEFASLHGFSLWDALKHIEEIDALNAGVKQRIAEFTRLIESMQETAKAAPVGELTKTLLSLTSMRSWYDDGTEEGQERWKNILELQSVMSKYAHLDPHTSLTSFLEEAALVAETDKLNQGADALTLMTLHLCKGLEFDHVIIVGCEEGIFPHSSSMFDREQLEEERRIMYVGMTRARAQLRLMLARERLLWGERKSNEPSRFLDDLPDSVERRSDDVLSAFAWSAQKAQQTNERTFAPRSDLNIEFNQDVGMDDDMDQTPFDEGVKIEHPVFGRGTITSRRGDIVEINFDSGKAKTFALGIAPLKKV